MSQKYNNAQSDAKGFIPDEDSVFVYPPALMGTAQSASANSSVTSNNTQMENKTKEIVSLSADKSFEERKHFSIWDNFEYPRDGLEPGRVLIFSHEFYEDPSLSDRRGTRRDVNEIIICMQRLGFNINRDDVHLDYTANDIKKKLDTIITDENEINRLRECNCLIVFVLTHGFDSEEIYAKDTSLKTSEIWSKFADCPALEGKPKLFVFQACKGLNHATIVPSTGTPPAKNASPKEKEAPAKLFNIDQPLGKDMLLFYATIEGNESYRNPLTGTWFIQELCKNFSAYGWRDDVLSMLVRTTKCVCRNYYDYHLNTPTDIEKQLPIYVSTLRKKFYLNRNKDRDMVINIEKKLEQNFQITKEILDILKKKGSTYQLSLKLAP